MGGKGLVDFYMFRLEFAKPMAFTWVEKHPVDMETKQALQNFATKYDSYYTMFGNETKKVDITWLSLLPAPGQQLLRLVEAARLCR